MRPTLHPSLSMALLALTLMLPTLPPMADEITIPSKTILVEDGDTVVVDIDGKPQRLQLAGIDAPENTENPKFQRDLQRTRLPSEQLLALGQAAAAHAEKLITNNGPIRVDYDPEKRDRYGRLLADVALADGTSLSLHMLEEGYAAPLSDDHPGTSATTHPFLQGEKSAVNLRRGLWSSHYQGMLLWRNATP